MSLRSRVNPESIRTVNPSTWPQYPYNHALRIPEQSEVRERILSLAMEPRENTPEEFRAFMKADLARWSQAVKDTNIPTVTQR